MVGNEPVGKVVQHAQLVEDLGFHGVWIADTQLILRECYVLMAAVALHTSRIKIGPGVTVPRTRHASVMASAFATLNENAPGRMRVGIGIGDTALRGIGQPRAAFRELEQYVSMVRGLLNNETVQFGSGIGGKITWLEEPTNIPIYVAATGPKAIGTAARLGNEVMLLRGRDQALLQEGIAIARQSAQDAGRSPDHLDVAIWIPLSMAPDSAVAREHAQPLATELLKMCRVEMFSEDEQSIVRRVHEEYDLLHQGWNARRSFTPVPDHLLDKFVLAGSPEEIRDKVAQLSRIEGINEIIIAPRSLKGGELPPVDWALKAFASQVLAQVV